MLRPSRIAPPGAWQPFPLDRSSIYKEVCFPVRSIFRAAVFAFVVLGLACAFRDRAAARPAQEMLPEQSAAKAKELVQRVIAALGGQAYLNVRDTQCDGRIAQYGTAGTMMGFTLFRDLWILPDKNRVEYISKGEHSILAFLVGTDTLLITNGGALITVYNGKEGWTLDKAGVSNEPDDLIMAFDDQLKTGMNNMLRQRIHEPGVEMSYGGSDLIDLKEAEWIEFTDPEHHEMRLGIDKYSHLPLRWIVATRNPDTREHAEIVTSYTQYLTQDGVKSPLSIEVSRNDRKVSQTFLSNCKYNSDLDPQLFTRAWLEQHAAEVQKNSKNSKDAKANK